MPVSTATSTSRILIEDVLTLPEARTELFRATGRRPDKSTLTRWIHHGVGGTKLEHVRLGNQILVSRQALTRFIEARTRQSGS
ncbi:hypothetical protein K227x_05910 [Rubripirellula lacrimiformis]|uniref:Uncharacterized protein n=1 Tax=Rubripirellula lacrimiformis TaxID=1930273 RepID=A0A517N506_9BACT|nr:DUF1580 domain-containing protein [Rubripirellula lacrimiformis]QDT02219.1 hypothetical protein K227x_05910 [Rubripirellula lacrimiformis]